MTVALTPGGSLTKEGRDEALELLREAAEMIGIRPELEMKIRLFLERFESDA